MLKSILSLAVVSAKLLPIELNTGDQLVPFRVAIYHHDLLQSAGVLLRNDIVLTTADQHTRDKANYNILLNSTIPPANLAGSGLTALPIKDKVIHPEFQPTDATSNNICILKLDLQTSPPLIMHTNSSMEEMFLHIVGWGYPIEVTTQKPQSCRQAIKSRLVNPEYEFCFATPLTHSEATKYPQGSPLFIDMDDGKNKTVILAGLYSWPLRTHASQVPLIVLKISKFRDWIQATMDSITTDV